MIEFKNCHLLIAVQPREYRADPSQLEVIYSDDNVRILKMHDFAATPEKGQDVVRVDIFK